MIINWQIVRDDFGNYAVADKYESIYAYDPYGNIWVDKEGAQEILMKMNKREDHYTREEERAIWGS